MPPYTQYTPFSPYENVLSNFRFCNSPSEVLAVASAEVPVVYLLAAEPKRWAHTPKID